MVVPRFSPHVGGVETHVRSIATRLLEAGVKVEVLTAETAPRLPRRAVASGIPVRRFRAILPSATYPGPRNVPVSGIVRRADGVPGRGF